MRQKANCTSTPSVNLEPSISNDDDDNDDDDDGDDDDDDDDDDNDDDYDFGEYATTIMLRTLNTVMNITQNQSRRPMMLQSFGISQKTQKDLLKPIVQILV